VTVDRDGLRSGESLADAFAIASSSSDVVAVGVNCCAAGDVSPALDLARSRSDLPLIAYPNSGEEWDGAARAWVGEPGLSDERFAEWAKRAAGLGGCCRVPPATIGRIARMVAA
jgi:homocysteine S-methyltransferase